MSILNSRLWYKSNQMKKEGIIISEGALPYYSGTNIYKMKQRIDKNNKKQKYNHNLLSIKLQSSKN